MTARTVHPLVHVLARPFRSMLGCMLVFGVAFAAAQIVASAFFLELDPALDWRLAVMLVGNLIAGALGGALVWWTILRPLQKRAELIRQREER